MFLTSINFSTSNVEDNSNLQLTKQKQLYNQAEQQLLMYGQVCIMHLCLFVYVSVVLSFFAL